MSEQLKQPAISSGVELVVCIYTCVYLQEIHQGFTRKLLGHGLFVYFCSRFHQQIESSWLMDREISYNNVISNVGTGSICAYVASMSTQVIGFIPVFTRWELPASKQHNVMDCAKF